MEFLTDLFAQLRDLESLVATAGYVGVTGGLVRVSDGMTK
jgi:hypothetical protein